jgi:hypothetical protein
MINTAEAMAILKEFGVEVIPSSGHSAPGNTKALRSLQRIVNHRGYDHARFLILTWKESNIRKTVLDAPTAWALSDTIKAMEKNFPDILTNDPERWFRFVDGLPIGWMQEWARPVDDVNPRRHVMFGQIWERAIRIFGAKQGDLLDDRRLSA